MAKQITQPDLQAEKELNSIIENGSDQVNIGKDTYEVKWLHPITNRKISKLMLKDGNDSTISYKVAAAIVVNSLWGLWLVYPILWRWFFFVKRYTEGDLSDVIAMGKKKIQLSEYYLNIILMTDMKDTIMGMTKKEMSAIRQEQITAQSGNSQKSTDG